MNRDEGEVSVGDVCDYLQLVAPLELAEEWDNVGLLLGRRKDAIKRIATCLTLSPDVVAGVIDDRVDLVVSHHPLPFRPMRRITGDDPASSLVLSLIQNGVAVYSAHTAFDSSAGGINNAWASRLDLRDVRPIEPAAASSMVGSGRIGKLEFPMSVSALAELCGDAPRTRFTGDANAMVQTVAIACGSGGSFIGKAIQAGCDVLLTGEATYHSCLEARAAGVAVVMVGHFASERFAMISLAKQLAEQFVSCEVAAAVETDVVL